MALCIFFNSFNSSKPRRLEENGLQKRPTFLRPFQPENSPRLLELLFLLWTEILPFTSNHFDEVLLRKEKRLLRELCQSFLGNFSKRGRSFTSIIELKGWTSNLSRQLRKNKESESGKNHDVHHGVRILAKALTCETFSYQFFPGPLHLSHQSSSKKIELRLKASLKLTVMPIPKENVIFQFPTIFFGRGYDGKYHLSWGVSKKNAPLPPQFRRFGSSIEFSCSWMFKVSPVPKCPSFIPGRHSHSS